MGLKVSITEETRWFTHTDVAHRIPESEFLAMKEVEKDNLGMDSQLKFGVLVLISNVFF